MKPRYVSPRKNSSTNRPTLYTSRYQPSIRRPSIPRRDICHSRKSSPTTSAASISRTGYSGTPLGAISEWAKAMPSRSDGFP